MIVVALMAAVLGGYYFAILVAAAATAMFYEWTRIVRGRGAGWDDRRIRLLPAPRPGAAVDPRP